jgi:3-oxoadipate enol-lactonase
LPLPPARTVHVPGRGEFFLRDTGGTGPTVLLLHGWLASADLNWCAQFADLARAGYRVLSPDHRGHGRGLRSMAPFRLADCAADAAGVLRELGAAPAVVVGYSMGGAISQLVARDHSDVVGGLILSATATDWKDERSQRSFKLMGAWGLLLTVAPRLTWRAGLKRIGVEESERTAWVLGELMRHSATDMAEAGRELGRFDSRPWLADVDVAAAVLITTRDDVVSPRKQRELVDPLRAEVFEAPINHLDVITGAHEYNPPLLQAITAVSDREGVKAA